MKLENAHTGLDSNNTSTESVFLQRPASVFKEWPAQVMEVAPQLLRRWTRRDLLLFGAGAVAAVVAGGALLPQTTLKRLGIIHENREWPRKEWLLNKSLRIDDDVAEALYSKDRLVPTYTKSQITALRNNYNGATPDPSYIPAWHLTLEGLASGSSVSLNIRNLLAFSSCMSKSPAWCALKVGARLPGGPGSDLMICCMATRQCRKQSGFVSNHQSMLVPGEIPTHTTCRLICRRRVIGRPCSRLI